jgi:drug/metabolite transporter (DMT)-like permease
MSIRKGLLKKHRLNEILGFFYLGTVISASVLFLLLKPDNLRQNNKTITLSIMAGALLPMAAYMYTMSLNNVSNMAYAAIVISVFKILFLFLISIYIFQVSFNKMTILGIIISLIGISIVICYK